MTVTDTLNNKHFRGNQTQLAKELDINRGTLRLYMTDKKGDYHFIVDGSLYSNLSNKIPKGGVNHD